MLAVAGRLPFLHLGGGEIGIGDVPGLLQVHGIGFQPLERLFQLGLGFLAGIAAGEFGGQEQFGAQAGNGADNADIGFGGAVTGGGVDQASAARHQIVYHLLALVQLGGIVFELEHLRGADAHHRQQEAGLRHFAFQDRRARLREGGMGQ